MNPNDFHQKLSEYRTRIEKTLTQLLTDSTHPTRLEQAMQYSTLHAGKRLRPILVYATGECLGQSLELLDYAAAAIECIHCYSLIHDDLPAMDNDELRRGKPTCHIAFDHATAILAGDALQCLAFECLSLYQNTDIPFETQLSLFNILAHYSGKSGMVQGQSLDLLAANKALTPLELERIHALKTGALIEASVRLGSVAACCKNKYILDQLQKFANQLGLAFQLQDDLLDTAGYSVLFGKSITQQRIQTVTNHAVQALDELSIDTGLLRALCMYLVERKQ